LHTISDKRTITRLLSWLNRASARFRKTKAKDVREWSKAISHLYRTDPRVNMFGLVLQLNEVRRWYGRTPRRYGPILLRAANQELRMCRLFPQVRAPGKRARVVHWSAAPGTSRAKRAYLAMVPAILSLHERGILSSVRACAYAECGEWFYADPAERLGKARFHSTRCRGNAHYAALSDEEKQRRSEYEAKRRKRKRKEAKLKEKQAAEEQLRYIRRMK
jgi:hypothetical protein